MMKNHKSSLFAFWVGLCALCFIATPALSEFCGDNSPARPVAECVNASGTPVACSTAGAIQLWPDGFRPGGARRGGQVIPNPLPKSRDSTQRVAGLTVPGARSGHELFKSVDIIDDKLFVAYNAGLQVWDLSRNPENPGKITSKDGFLDQFLTFPDSNEQLAFIEDLDAIDPGPSQNILIFVSGKHKVGPSIWEFDGSVLKQLYQDFAQLSRQVRVVEFEGVVYGFTSTDRNLAVYNLTAATKLDTPCLDEKGTSPCSAGIYLGDFPGLTVNRYVDVHIVDGRLFVATADGFYQTLKIWELLNPGDPSSAVQRFRGAGTHAAAGPEFFEYNNDLYLAFVQNSRLKIHTVDDCLDADGCTNLGACQADGGACEVQLSTWDTPERYVTFSESNGTPFLYYGGSPINAQGPQIEQLLDISELGTANPTLHEVTEGAGTYTDPCNGKTVDYWGDYLPRNNNGFRDFYPRIGKFRGNYFYRAAQTVLDVHVRENVVVEPQIVVAAQTPADAETGAYWFGDPITFTSTAQNCTPSNTWIWDQSSAKTVAGLNAATTNIAELSWQGCSSGDGYCADETVAVMAVPDSGCGDSPEQVQLPDPFVLKDPRARVDALNAAPAGNSFAAGTEVTFTAEARGKRPYSYNWKIFNSVHQEVASGSDDSLIWSNTCEAINVPTILLADGFESGNLSAWEVFNSPLPAAGRSRAVHNSKNQGLAETFEVRLTLTTTDNGAADTFSTSVTLTQPGAVAFNHPALTITDLGGGTFRLAANTSNATEWRWEIEDPDGGNASCAVFADCGLFDWSAQGQEIVYTWQQPGTFNVRVWARNTCSPETIVHENTLVDATDIVVEPLEVTSFMVSNENPNCTQSLGFVDCLIQRQITFNVTFTGEPTALEVDWNGDGNYVSVIPPANGGLLHTYTSNLFNIRPRIRAVRGLETSASRTLSGTLAIVDSL